MRWQNQQIEGNKDYGSSHLGCMGKGMPQSLDHIHSNVKLLPMTYTTNP